MLKIYVFFLHFTRCQTFGYLGYPWPFHHHYPSIFHHLFPTVSFCSIGSIDWGICIFFHPVGCLGELGGKMWNLCTQKIKFLNPFDHIEAFLFQKLSSSNQFKLWIYYPTDVEHPPILGFVSANHAPKFSEPGENDLRIILRGKLYRFCAIFAGKLFQSPKRGTSARWFWTESLGKTSEWPSVSHFPRLRVDGFSSESQKTAGIFELSRRFFFPPEQNTWIFKHVPNWIVDLKRSESAFEKCEMSYLWILHNIF